MTQPHTTHATMNSTQGIGFFAALILNRLSNQREIQKHNEEGRDRAKAQDDPAEQTGDEVAVLGNKRASL